MNDQEPTFSTGTWEIGAFYLQGFFTSWVLLKKINPLLETWNTWSNSFTFWEKYWKGYWQFFPHFAQNFFCCCHCFYFRFIFRFECKNVFLFFFHNNWLRKFRCKKLDFLQNSNLHISCMNSIHLFLPSLHLT